MSRGRGWRAAAAAIVWAVLLGFGSLASTAFAYTAAGDRLFPATILLPQISPGDEFYTNVMDLPSTPSGIGTPDHQTNLNMVFAKTITDRLGVFVEETYTQLGRVGGGSLNGWQNFDMSVKYLTVLDLPHEFLLTLGLDREFGDTGARRVGASPSGATTPQIFFGKGLGDLDVGYLRPVAITGFVGYQAADSRPRPDQAVGGLTLQYSIPYLQSKVQTLDLPEVLRTVTPITEFLFSTPAGQSFGTRTTALFAPGVSYAGEGWELAVEALVPATRATGRGVGVTAQLHLALDYLVPDTLGRPLFSAP
ncbi:MAG TPA: hypothetical protein VHU15_03335 [Stellaceae bacterium]|jgi:hypothetical protein|nr:hypothetical protein [Stellaceae bacterium]